MIASVSSDRAGVARRLLGVQAIEVVAQFGPALEAPAAAHAHELQAALRPVFLQFEQQRLDRVGAQFVVEQHAQFAHRQRLGRTDQGGFENALGIRRIHGSRYPGKGASRHAQVDREWDGRRRCRHAAGSNARPAIRRPARPSGPSGAIVIQPPLGETLSADPAAAASRNAIGVMRRPDARTRA